MLYFPKPQKDRSLSKLHAEGVSSSVENAAVAYQSPSILAAGANVKDVALLSTITNLVLAILLLKVPSIIKQTDALKRTVIILSIVSTLGWLPLILVTLLVKGISPTVLVILWVINLVPGLLAGPLIDKWLSDLVPSGKVGRYLSIRLILSTGTYISFFYVMGSILDSYHGYPSTGFYSIFIIAFAASSASLLICILLKVAVPLGETSASGFGMTEFIRESRQNNLGRFIVFTTSMMFAANISAAFFSVYMLRDLHFSYLDYTLVMSVEVLSRMGISYLGGRWIDRVGSIKVLRYAAMILPINPVLWLFSSNLAYLMCVQILSGISWATYDLCVQSYLCRDSPPGKRLHYIVYHKSIVTLAAAFGPLAGASLLNIMYPVFGNPILGIFLTSGILRLLVVIILLPGLKTTTDSESGCQELQPIGVSYLYKRAEVKSRPLPYSRPVNSPIKYIPRNKELNGKPERFYCPQRGAHYLTRPRDISPVEPVRATIKQNIRQDLLYRVDRRPQSPASSPLAAEAPCKVLRLKDNLSRDIEYHKRWAAKVTCAC